MSAEVLKQIGLLLSSSAWLIQLFLFVHSYLQTVRENPLVYSRAVWLNLGEFWFFLLSCMNGLTVILLLQGIFEWFMLTVKWGTSQISHIKPKLYFVLCSLKALETLVAFVKGIFCFSKKFIQHLKKFWSSPVVAADVTVLANN